MSDTPITDDVDRMVQLLIANYKTGWINGSECGTRIESEINKLRQLERENAALRADKERLDVLEHNLAHVSTAINPQMDGTRFVGQCQIDGLYRRFTGRSLRDFADSVRKEQP